MLTAATETATFFDALRTREFSRLERQRHAYLDYTGSALYGESQIRAHQELLASGIFGNPHSDSAPSRASTDTLDAARELVLRFLGVDASTHDVVFTANATGAIKLVAEGYPFTRDSACILSSDNHNSVNGIREYARRAGARVRYLPLDDELRLREPETILAEEAGRGGLVAFPAQSNFSGVRHPLSLVHFAHDLGYDVLLDIASYAPSQAISLRDCPADFATLSFYKLFGYPTGLGALVARREALARLHRPWFAGGTVTYASIGADTHRLRPRHEAFEDGTPNFLGAAALPAGFALMDAVGLPRLSAHVASLTALLLEELRALRHVRIYGPANMTARGGAIAFNVCSRDGRPIPYTEVETRATRADISIRGGCFCNPGAAEAAFGLDSARIADCFTTLGDTFTIDRFATCTGLAVGAVRVSMGMANNVEDVRRVVEVVAGLIE
ncbi:MAG TPA: aminotransferase class V-fold PLP-dependent enzyme [Thermoanaerobaculia bacterium]|nr:aminotransferase class V-fold PLP-dependent enzyme [Thermoanaerobaculia bacterium]